ncbi:hypothetical protein [Vibrio diabolicus]|nr:hypothetical protein [Vibrio diabolicus]
MLKPLTILSILLVFPFHLHAETIEKRNFNDKFGITSNHLIAEDVKGNRTKFRIEYYGHTWGKMWQTGHNAIPLKGQLTDTRKCHWNIFGTVERKVILEAAIGVEAEYKELSKIYEMDDIGDLGADNWVEGLFYARACTSKEERDYDQRYNGFKTRINAEIPKIKEAERNALIEELKKVFKVSKITVVS